MLTSSSTDKIDWVVGGQHGKSWKAIHESLPNKTREQVQSHGQYLIRTGKIQDLPKPM